MTHSEGRASARKNDPRGGPGTRRLRARLITFSSAGLMAVLVTATTGGSLAGAATSQSSINASVKAESQRPTSIGITQSPGPIPKNKTIDVAECSLPACVALVNDVQAGAKALGWKVVTVSIGDGSNPAQITSGYNQILANHPSAVIGSGFPKVLFSADLPQFKAQHIPVMELYVADPAGGGLTAVLAGPRQNVINGKDLADYTLSKAGAKSSTNTLFVNIAGFAIVQSVQSGFETEYKKECSSCGISTLTVPAANIGTQAEISSIVGFLQAHSNVNALVLPQNDQVAGLPSALVAAGVSKQLKSETTFELNSVIGTYINSGTWGSAVVSGTNIVVYKTLDYLIRYWNHRSVFPDTDANNAPPPWIVTKANIPATVPADLPQVANYAAQFYKLWGVKG